MEIGEFDHMNLTELFRRITKGERYAYAFTINLSPHRMINGKRWKNHTNEEQERLLEALWDYLTYTHNVFYHTHEYELTTTYKTKHLHGMMFGITPTQAHIMSDLVHDFYAYPSDPPGRVCYITPTEVNTDFYIQYMQKIKDREDRQHISVYRQTVIDHIISSSAGAP